jgi:alkanesulfonate monooxygenase SsuD/methylene tetrahydromethanopterin reductase-like flavin-dependent oxidoreductase (luciferase family)
MTTLGAVFRPQLPPEKLRDIARAAEAAGLEELWFWEDCFLESGIATASAALAWTERLRVGIGLLPVPLRNVALTAMETATLDRLFPGRFTLTVGHGVQDWMGQVGARAESPERVTTDGRYVKLDDVGLDWPPPTAPEVLAGVTGPRSLRLSGEAADGTLLSEAIPPDGVRNARRLIDEGRAAAGRTGSHRVVVYLLTATGPDAAARLQAERTASGTDKIPGLGVAGDAAAVAEAVQRLVAAGADTVVLEPTGDEPDPEGFVRFVAEDVRPLVP